MDFYLTLPSNGGGLEFNPTNSNTRYKIRLPHRILSKDDDWEVAMVSISFPVRDHHKHYMLSSFPRGTIVAKIAAQPTFASKREGTTRLTHLEQRLRQHGGRGVAHQRLG